MIKNQLFKQIAIIGGGPSALLMYKRLVESDEGFEISIFEKKHQLGMGMPYSGEGANFEHITNVSENEIPPLVTSIEEWSKTQSTDFLTKFNIDPNHFNEYKVLPRLFFGAYLEGQFELLQKKAQQLGLKTNIHLNTKVIDIIDEPKSNTIKVITEGGASLNFNHVIICSGHNWPKTFEGKVKGYYDSPYPPKKLNLKLNHAVALKGSSLTAIDAIRTLARNNGQFLQDDNGKLNYSLNKELPNFKMVMHSRSGLLPAVRIHLEDTHLKNDALLTLEEIRQHRQENGGFVSLDYIFNENFKLQFLKKDIAFYEKIKDLNLEQFVDLMMSQREKISPFELLKAEYKEAEKSIKRHQSVYWKELLGSLSFTLNYPAKYFSAEDMMRLKKTLMPLISIIIAFLPQSSCEEILALHEAGVLELVSVDDNSREEAHENGGVTYHYIAEDGRDEAVFYPTYINCIGQPHLNKADFPFKSLVNDQKISEAMLKFKSADVAEKMIVENKDILQTENGDYYLKIAGIGINDNYQVTDRYGSYNERIYIMAVPYIGGFNPDYSGLDFCEQASEKVINNLIKVTHSNL
jgi:uncharacterized NAD(P)/FAD-binding protein YdhS